jgi:hypothetical protein
MTNGSGRTEEVDVTTETTTAHRATPVATGDAGPSMITFGHVRKRLIKKAKPL